MRVQTIEIDSPWCPIKLCFACWEGGWGVQWIRLWPYFSLEVVVLFRAGQIIICLHGIFKWLLSKQTCFVDLHGNTGSQSPGVKGLRVVVVKGVQAWAKRPVETQRDWMTFGMPGEFIIGSWDSLSSASIPARHGQHKQTNFERSWNFVTTVPRSTDVNQIPLMSSWACYVTEGQEVFRCIRS